MSQITSYPRLALRSKSLNTALSRRIARRPQINAGYYAEPRKEKIENLFLLAAGEGYSCVDLLAIKAGSRYRPSSPILADLQDVTLVPPLYDVRQIDLARAGAAISENRARLWWYTEPSCCLPQPTANLH
jgi:hypothetical protein